MSFLEETFSLKGKTALVTGAARGMGCAMVDGLLRAGAQVIMVGSKPEPLRQAADGYRQDGLTAVNMPCDLGNAKERQLLLDRVSNEFERLDVLVNNAGVTITGHSLEYEPADWEKTLRVDLEAPFVLAQGAAKMMRPHGGSIINVTSVGAELGFPNNPAYAAAKGGLKQLTKALAADLGEYGIRVNNVGPGYFTTDMTRMSWDDPEKRKQRAERTILGRWGEPKDLVGLLILLASDASSYITGQDFYVDGGWTAKGL